MSAPSPSQFPGSEVPSKFAETSLLSLDSNAEAMRLVPGQSTAFAEGVSIAVINSANEGLLEVDFNLSGPVFIDGKPATEVSTVHTGQIIKTKAGRFVLMRRFQAIVVPREKGYQRTKPMQEAIDAAILTVNESNLLRLAPQPTAQEELGDRKAKNKKMILRGGIAAAGAIILASLYFGDSASQQKSATPLAPKNAASQANTALDPAAPPAAGEAAAVPTAVFPASGAEQTAAAPTAAAAAPTAATASAAMQPAASAAASANKASGKKAAPTEKGRSALSAKERQLIVEYKLEARFDRNGARAKLKAMSETFPPNSQKRLEVQRAYEEL